MGTYKLYCFAQSGNAYKVALALELAGADWEPVFVDFFKGQHRTPEFAEINPMAEVPVLEYAGNTLTQSGAILDFLTDMLDAFKPSDRTEALRWMFWDNHKLTSNLATWRFLVNFAPEQMRNPDVIAFTKGRAVTALKVLDAHLADREWIVGKSLSIVDLSCQGYVHYTDEYDFKWSSVPNVVAWRKRIQALPGWKHPYDLMPGHPLPE
ncbi:MAG: glutathione S-transferase [Pseudomonadota bacterium]